MSYESFGKPYWEKLKGCIFPCLKPLPYPLQPFVPEGANTFCRKNSFCFTNPVLTLLPAGPLSKEELKLVYPKGLLLYKKCSKKENNPPEEVPFTRFPLAVYSIDIFLNNLFKNHTGSISNFPDAMEINTFYESDSQPCNQNMNVARQTSLLPHIYVSIHDSQFLALIDSGCELSCVDEAHFQQIMLLEKFPTLPVANTRLRTAMSQSSPRIRTQVYITFTIENKVFHHTFLVVRNLVRPFILGVDWLYNIKAVINLYNKHLIVRASEEIQNIPFCLVAALQAIPFSNFVGNDNLNEPSLNSLIVASGETYTTTDSIDITAGVATTQEINSKIENLGELNVEEKKKIRDVLLRYRSIFNKYPGKTTKYIHEIKMHDKTPFVKRPYPIPISLRPAVEQTLSEMLKLGVIKREATPFASPMTVVSKKDGTVRICLDARWINNKMVPDHEAPISPEELLHSIKSVKFLSTIDLRASYWQIPLSEESIPYTGFLYGGQSFTYQVLPFGLKTAVASFTRAMDRILGPEIRTFTLVYIDDLLVVSSSFEEHLLHLNKLFSKLADAGMTINLEKTHLFRSEVPFLGHIISTRGVLTDPTKISAIKDFPTPQNLKQLRSFLGLCSYYRRFISKFSNLVVPLSHLLKKGTPWRWTSECQTALEQIKQVFLKTVILTYPNFQRTFYLQTDSSHYALGAELYQLDDQENHLVLGFISRLLHGPELHYTVTEKELLAIVFGLKKFQTLILGHKIIIRTDHSALKFLKQCPLLNDRLTRWMLFLNKFNFDIEHVPGKDNIVADTLSRNVPGYDTLAQPNISTPIISTFYNDYLSAFFEAPDKNKFFDLLANLRQDQLDDNFLGPIFHYYLGYPNVLDQKQIRYLFYFHTRGNILVFESPPHFSPKIALPEKLIRPFAWTFHEHFGHIGVVKLYLLLKPFLFIIDFKRKLQIIVRTCELCQKVKHPQRNLCGPCNPILAKEPGDLVLVDFYGPLPEGRSRASYIFVVIDSFSKFVRLYPLGKANAKAAANRIVNDYTKYVPIKVVLSDHGTQFLSKHWQSALKGANIRITYSSIRHPASNPSERVMRELGRLFRTYCSQSHAGWVSHLNNIEDLFNNIPHITTGFSPCEILYGQNKCSTLLDKLKVYLPKLPPKTCTEIHDLVRARSARMAELRCQQRQRYNDKLQIGDYVLLREFSVSDASRKIVSKFCPLFSGPYIIQACPFPNVYTLHDPITKSRKGNYNITNLKYFYRVSSNLHG